MKAPRGHTQTTGAALILVLSMVVIMAGIVLTMMVVVSGERKASGQRAQSIAASQLAASAPQIVMSQIQEATTAPGTWASQPGMIRTFDNAGNADQVFKLYSASAMVAGGAGFSEAADAPPAGWNSGRNTALFADINRPQRNGQGGLGYPVADPGPAATAFGGSTAFSPDETEPVPGYEIDLANVPGFAAGEPAGPDNNPLPMPVRWLYVLENGEMAIPQSVGEDGVVAFSGEGATPNSNNPVVGRLAFWTDDDTAKVNVNTAGFARNDDDYWTYWDTPVVWTRDENFKLSYGQPWTKEYARYPGHPATTGLNVVFDSLDLNDEQILSLTPRYVAGGTQGASTGRTTPPSRDEVDALFKNERLFASIDELFYNPQRGANAAGIARESLEARRFLLTSSSRAPETTLFNTPRVTIWPSWPVPDTPQDERRTPVDRLIAFTSTLAGQAFYFVRNDPMSGDELIEIPQNLDLWNYLEVLSMENVPGFGGSFRSKYGTGTSRQILTSIFDAIRITNLDDRLGEFSENGTPLRAWSFTARQLEWSANQEMWLPSRAVNAAYTPGFVAPTVGPHGTRAVGRAPTLAEAVFQFSRVSNATTIDDSVTPSITVPFQVPDPRFELPEEDDEDPVTIPEWDIATGTLFLGFFTPSAGMVQPGQDRRIVVRGLDQFRVRTATPDANGNPVDWQRVIPSDIWDYTEIDGDPSRSYDQRYVFASRRYLGGRIEYTSTRQLEVPGAAFDTPPLIPAVPDGRVGGRGSPGGDGLPEASLLVLPQNIATQNEISTETFEFSGGQLTVEVYIPANATDPLHVYQLDFPPAQALTPIPATTSNLYSGTPPDTSGNWHWRRGNNRFANTPYEERNSGLGDTLLGVHSPTGDFRSEVLRASSTTHPISDFVPHRRYGSTDLISSSITTAAAGTDTSPTVLSARDIAGLSRRASIKRWQRSPGYGVRPELWDLLLGRLIHGFNDYNYLFLPQIPPIPNPSNPNETLAIQTAFPPGDFSNGPGIVLEGSLSPKADEGARITITEAGQRESPYFRNVNTRTFELDGTLSSPNRQVASAVSFGNIPTGTWRTLLFRPDNSFPPFRAAGNPSHPGATSPPDYLILDWFHMPVVEPYAISEPFSTAGKINLNSHIMPFGNYVRRETGLAAVLQSARLVAIPDSFVAMQQPTRVLTAGWNYLDEYEVPDLPTRFPLNVAEVVSLIRDRFTGADGNGRRVYLTSAEICTINLVPEGFTRNNLQTFWADKRTTGSNSLEAPYSSLLPRLTARSNTYTVHVTAQALATSREDGGWQEGSDTVVSEWRGAFELERYIDPNDVRFNGAEVPNFLSGTISVEPYYKFRMLGETRFDP